MSRLALLLSLALSSTVFAAQNNLEIQRAALESVCRFHGDQAECEPSFDMPWRLRQHLTALDEYARAAVSAPGVDGAERARLLSQVTWLQTNVGSRYREELAHSPERIARQDQLIAVLNDQFGCRIRRYNEGEQQTYRHEISAPVCDALKEARFDEAARLLAELAQVSIPADREILEQRARMYRDFGPDVRDLAQLRRQLLDLKVIELDGERVRVSRIGHPFQRQDYTNYLEAYIHSAVRLSRRLGGASAYSGCPEPACDPVIYKLAEAVTLRPPLDWVYLRDGDAVVAPSPYGLSYFSQRYAANSAIRHAIGLDPDQDWMWSSDIYQSSLSAPENVLMFPRLFRKEQILVSVQSWSSRTEYPYVVPLFFLFQETRGVVNALNSMRANAIASAIKEIRYEPADGSGQLVQISRIPSSGYRLSLKVMNPPQDLPVEQVRRALQQQIPVYLQRAVQLAHEAP